MSKYLFFFFLIVGCTTQVIGQIKPTVQPLPPGKTAAKEKAPPQKPEDIAKNTADNLKKALGLNEQQRNSIYKVVLDHAVGINKIKTSKFSNKDKYNKTVALDQNKRKQFEKIMTKEQYNSYIMTFP